MALPSSVHSLDRSSLSFVSRKNRPGHQQFGQPSVAVQPVLAVHLLRIYLCQHIWASSSTCASYWLSSFAVRRIPRRWLRNLSLRTRRRSRRRCRRILRQLLRYGSVRKSFRWRQQGWLFHHRFLANKLRLGEHPGQRFFRETFMYLFGSRRRRRWLLHHVCTLWWRNACSPVEGTWWSFCLPCLVSFYLFCHISRWSGHILHALLSNICSALLSRFVRSLEQLRHSSDLAFFFEHRAALEARRGTRRYVNMVSFVGQAYLRSHC